ncbi:M18 family aminopeptidase [Brachybacterium sp. JHP9]|uniref:M18 family aminopeptidase n=1 Tax=Brachybacterium equifaecis TaxID=2910770 RepID=A0ABT0QZJ0_9MICO|nr:M18 family aminopeptidase [Brachybacterium equifaecis]MCL6422464.1 M18 family aminopeptidase [Brachybacterium equifaecis]
MTATAPDRTAAAREFVADLGAFVTASPSSFHAAAESARRLEAAGFVRLREMDPWSEADVRGDRLVVRDGSVIAWSMPEDASVRTSFRILGSHTDSPALKVKPNPQLGAEGLAQVGTEVYGGALLNSWLDRELRLAGRLVLRGGDEVLVATGPLLRVPQLAVHLDRGVNAEGLRLDPQRHMQPIIGVGSVDVLGLLADEADVSPADVLGFDIVAADAQAPARFGAHQELMASGRLDNLSSVHASLMALLRVAADRARDAPLSPIALMVANDHEEVGSASRSGAAGPFLEDVLVRIHAGLGGDEATRRAALAGSVVVSSDAGHAAHPNYPERHDPVTRPRLGAGPVLKINANQRYATDARGAALFSEACARAGVPMQTFVSNNAMPCGSTIGPITATRLGMTTIDVGIALLSMHSVREMCAVEDPLSLSLACETMLR